MSRLHLEDAFVYDENDKGPSNRPFSIGRRMFKGGSAPANQTTTVQLPDYVQPYAVDLMNRSAALSNQDVPQYGGQMTAGLNSDQNAAINMIRQRAMSGSADINAARNNLAATMQGQFFAPSTIGNPYLDNVIQKTQGDIARNYAAGTGAQTLAQFRNAGAFGGSAMQETQDMQNRALGDALSNASSTMRMQDYQQGQQLDSQNYNAERQRQIQAMMFAPQLANTDYQNYQALLGIGDIQRDDQQNQLNDAYQRWLNQVNAPYQQLETLAGGITGATGGGMARQQMSPNPYQRSNTAGALGGALGGAATGAMLGSVVPGIGTGIGALAGGAMGLFGGLF